MKKNNKIIYVPLQGRIGNQLFIYAFAKNLAMLNPEYQIVIDDSEVLRCNWVNSLCFYNLSNVIYVHNKDNVYAKRILKQKIMHKLISKWTRNSNYMDKYKKEISCQKMINKLGLIECENGYIDYKKKLSGDTMICGYFQSEKYFLESRDIIKNEFIESQREAVSQYIDIEKIRNRNTVCISIKVEHNVGSELYDVCTLKYWEEAIDYMMKNVENPLFFICSDNVEYVKNNLISVTGAECICQDSSYPVHVALAAMSECKHFIIGNTSFGWWAQYLCEYENKIVIAPSKWMKVNMPIDIYDDKWMKIEV